MDELHITTEILIPRSEIEMSAIRSQGAGGQNVNKVSTGIHLRFDIHNSSLPETIKLRLIQQSDHRINKDGVIIIKSQQTRSQEQNRVNALKMLQTIIQSTLVRHKPRKKTRPKKSAIKKRIDNKKGRGKLKELRQKITH